jgi:hypothetical protein
MLLNVKLLLGQLKAFFSHGAAKALIAGKGKQGSYQLVWATRINQDPVYPSFTRSGSPPTLVAIIGNPLAIASMTAMGNPSVCDGNIKISAVRNCANLASPTTGE